MPTPCKNPKRFFGAARNIEGGGSLTIIATALIETGKAAWTKSSLKNSKAQATQKSLLDRKLADKRIFPAIDIPRSGHPQGRPAGR